MSYQSNPGTVTSVALTVPTGFSVSGSPVTSSGTLAITTTSANTGWVLKSYTTGSAVSNVTVSIDLNTDLTYLFEIEVEGLSAADALRATVNSDASALHDSLTNYAEGIAGVAASANYVQNGVNEWRFTAERNFKNFSGMLQLTRNLNGSNQGPHGVWHIGAHTYAGPDQGIMRGSGAYNSGGILNITNVKFMAAGGATGTWRIRCYTLAVA